MKNLLINEQRFKLEHKVILEEWRSGSIDSPYGYANEFFLAQAYIKSPYRQPIIGWPEDVQSLTVEKLKRWYNTWYAPNNASLIIVGDINSKKLRKSIEYYFSSIPSKKLPQRQPLTDINEPGERSLNIKHPLSPVSVIFMGINVPVHEPGANNWEPYALLMLANVLDGGSSARFESELIRKQRLATYINTDYDPYSRGETLFTVYALPDTDTLTHPDHLIEAIWQQLEWVKQTPPSPAEMARALSKLRASEIFKKDSVSQRAEELGLLSSLALPVNRADEYHEKLKAVTPEQIQRVAQTYFKKNRLTRVTLQSSQERLNTTQENSRQLDFEPNNETPDDLISAGKQP